MPNRTATTRWQGDLPHGRDTVRLDSSNAGEFAVSFPTRAAEPGGRTSPEELPAAAHPSCPAMNLADVLGAEHPTAAGIDVSTEITVGRVPA